MHIICIYMETTRFGIHTAIEARSSGTVHASDRLPIVSPCSHALYADMTADKNVMIASLIKIKYENKWQRMQFLVLCLLLFFVVLF